MTVTTSLAVLSDVHGNVWALEAVLADIARRGVSLIVELGDSLDGPLEPRATADRLRSLDIPGIRGNGERSVLDPARAARNRSAGFARAALAPGDLAWLADRPATRSIDGILLCHGTPRADDVYLLEEAQPEGQRLRAADAVVRLLADSPGRVVLCGHSHLPRSVVLPDGRLIVNPGSVGLPAYRDDEPPHAMETGSPQARYALLERRDEGWRVELVAVPYNHQLAIDRARRNGREDWARWLTGWA
jgi:predicted phosphodiesterase